MTSWVRVLVTLCFKSPKYLSNVDEKRQHFFGGGLVGPAEDKDKDEDEEEGTDEEPDEDEERFGAEAVTVLRSSSAMVKVGKW